MQKLTRGTRHDAAEPPWSQSIAPGGNTMAGDLPAQVVLALRDIRVDYAPGQTALEVPALDIHAGRSYAVVGPNGAGKSTLFKVCTLLLRPQQGRLLWRGQDVLHSRTCSPTQLRQHVVLVPQHPVMLRTSVFRNVAYGLKIRRWPQRDIAPMVEAALFQVRMTAHATRPARALSGGEIQRVALARALAVQPHVLLLDEPTANLDAASFEVIEALVLELKAHGDRTILFTTHDLSQAHRLSDAIISLESGCPIEPPQFQTSMRSHQAPKTWMSRCMHQKETAIWQQAELQPEGQHWYFEVGQGAGATLQVANNKQAYTLIDQGTYLAYRGKLALDIVHEGDPVYVNPYSVIAVNPQRHPHVNHKLTGAFIDWLISAEGQRRIGDFRKHGQVLLSPTRCAPTTMRIGVSCPSSTS